LNTYQNLQKQIDKLVKQEIPPLLELRKSLLDVEDFIDSSDYKDLSTKKRNRIQELRKALRASIKEAETADSQLEEELESSGDSETPQEELIGQIGDKIDDSAPTIERDSKAEQAMEDAEKLFYGGRYVEAIKLFDRVLQIEPNWERAKQHRSESENYLRTGYIPPIALPAEAASAFGKAQSAARVGRYQDALTLLNRAQNIMRDLGIQRWQEGLDFEQKLQENIDAENAYLEGIELFDRGEIDDAIELIESASKATGSPKYSDRAQEYRRVKETIRGFNETLSAITIDPNSVLGAKSDLDILTSEYGENPLLIRLRSRLENVIPKAVAPMKDQIRSLKTQAERASTIEETHYLSTQARNQLDQTQSLVGLDESLERLQVEVDNLIINTQRYEDELSQAQIAFQNHKNWPVQAARISQEVRQRYPNDPKVVRFSRSLTTYNTLLNLIKISGGLLLLILLGLFAWFGWGRINVYYQSLTPTSTPTASDTSTPTTTSTATATITLTSTPTLTFTPTPTPTTGMALRDIWARSDCYEGYNAVGRIPLGGILQFLQTDRRFDSFNRECVLVEYQENGRTVIGWVLFIDIGNIDTIPITTTTP